MGLIVINGIGLKEEECETLKKTIHKLNHKREENDEKKIEFAMAINGKTTISRELHLKLKK